MRMRKASYPLHLAQANLRRWLDKRVPLTAGNVELPDAQQEILFNMVSNWEIPVLIRKEGEDNYSVIVDEGNGKVDDMYVAYVNVTDKTIRPVLNYMGVSNNWRCI
jgi:predicted RecB family endonuclease